MSKRIMLVEDDPSLAVSLETVLKISGYETIHAANGQLALEMLDAQEQLPDLLIVDVMMPVMDGIEFRKSQLNSRFRDIPVIFLTATEVDRDEVRELRPYEYLKKPIELNDLKTILKNFFY